MLSNKRFCIGVLLDRPKDHEILEMLSGFTSRD